MTKKLTKAEKTWLRKMAKSEVKKELHGRKRTKAKRKRKTKRRRK